MSTSSSSSEDEDLAKFASVAVSAEQIHIQSREEAQKRAAQATRAPISSGARPAAVSAAAAAVAGTPKHDDDEVTGLDLVSVKIAAALDAMIAKKLSIPDSKPESSTARTPGPHSTPQPASTAAAPSTDATPAHTSGAAAAADPIDSFDDGTGVQLFRTVPKGTPCIIPHSSRTDAWEALSQDQHQHDTAAVGGFGSASLPRTQPMREQIPRLCLAETSQNGCKRKHDEILTALTVNGKALRAAAAAAGYANRAVPGTGSSSVSSSASTAGKVVNTAGWVKCWRRLKGQKDPGVVVDAKPWVPYEERAAKLLGRQSVSAS